jgi:phosphatidylglycerophosphate synthase
MEVQENRRPLRTRSAQWAAQVAAWVGRKGVTPNAISVIGVGFAALAAALFLWVPSVWGFLAAACAIQLRLLCNMLDGMVAIEGGKKSSSGDLYNEFPDRLEDSLILIAAGYAVDLGALGWACALMAALTAHARAYGGALKLTQDFCGPMAKQHRMFTVTLACLISAIELAVNGSLMSLEIALWVIVVGAAWTWVRRLLAMAALLKRDS